MQLSLQDKVETDLLTNTAGTNAVFSTLIPLCQAVHFLSAITQQHAQSFPVLLTWNKTMKKALLHGRYSAMTLLCNTTLLCVGHHPLLAVKAKIHPV